MPSVARLVVRLAGASQSRAIANARAATTELCARRLEREAVAAFLENRDDPEKVALR